MFYWRCSWCGMSQRLMPLPGVQLEGTQCNHYCGVQSSQCSPWSSVPCQSILVPPWMGDQWNIGGAYQTCWPASMPLTDTLLLLSPCSPMLHISHSCLAWSLYWALSVFSLRVWNIHDIGHSVMQRGWYSLLKHSITILAFSCTTWSFNIIMIMMTILLCASYGRCSVVIMIGQAYQQQNR